MVPAVSRAIDTHQLLTSVRNTFFELGPGASSRELAKRAQVSEGTLFKRYGTKDGLFAAAMELEPLGQRVWFKTMLERAGQTTLREQLLAIGTDCIHFVWELLPRVHLLFASGLKMDAIHQVLGFRTPPPLLLVQRLAAYFEAEMARGRMRHENPDLLASLFIGYLIQDFIAHEPEPQEQPSGASRVEAVVDLFVRQFASDG